MSSPNTPAKLGRLAVAALLCLASGLSAAQSSTSTKNRWSFYWGWNWETYSQSDIHFHGDNHDFTLKSVVAEDKPKELSLHNLGSTYLRPDKITIPQTNARLAYEETDGTIYAINLDHMKYVATPGQTVQATGQVKGVDISGPFVMSEATFGHYEHTDGLNILSLETEKQMPVQWFGAGVSSRLFMLAGAGIVIPKSNVTLTIADRTRNDKFHIAGYSFGVGGGLEVDFLKDWFVRTALKAGYVNLPDVVTSSKGDKASQHFTYTEALIAAGLRF